MENQIDPSQTISEKLNRRYWDVAFTYWLMFGFIMPLIIWYIFAFSISDILMMRGIEINYLIESVLSLFSKPIIIWLVIQFMAAGFYIGKQRFVENKFRIINSATALVGILNLLLIILEHIGSFDFRGLIFKVPELILSLSAFYFASKKYLPPEDLISVRDSNDSNQIENIKSQSKRRRKIIFVMIVLMFIYFIFSFLRMNRATAEVPNMQKVIEQFIFDIQSDDLQSASNLLINDLQGAESEEFLLTLSRNFKNMGGVKEYKITNTEIRSSGLRIYGNFTGQILYESGKNIPFIFSITRENGQYKIHILNF